MTALGAAVVTRRSALAALGDAPAIRSRTILLEEVGPLDEWVLRGPRAIDAVTGLSGVAPQLGRRSTATIDGDTLERWVLAADEVVLAASAGSDLAARIGALESDDVSVVEMTGGWTTLRLGGSSAPSLMTHLCPVDTSPATVPIGGIVQAPLVGVRAVIARDDARDPTYLLRIARDEALYAWEAMSRLARVTEGTA